MVEAEAFRPALPHPIGARGFQHVVGAGDVGLDEIARPVDRTVDMAFGGQVHHRIGLMLGKNPVQRGAVTDIDMLEGVKRAARNRGHVVETGGIGQRIDIDDRMPARHSQPHHRRADKARTARDQQLHAEPSQMKGLSKLSKGTAASSLAESTGVAHNGQSMPQLSQCTAPSQSGA